MNLETLHPLIVHFPMALAVLQPMLLVLLIIGISKKFLTPNSWWIVIGFQAVLVVSAVLAIMSGEIDEEIVEKVVQESLIEEHEDIAKIFTMFSGATLAIMILPVFIQAKSIWVKVVTLIFSLFSLGSGIQVGKLGGELVYQHNAASAHVERIDNAQKNKKDLPESKDNGSEEHDDDDDD